MRILLVNDDGITARGMTALARIAATLSGDLWTVAPLGEMSGVACSTGMARPLRTVPFGNNRIGADATPVGCVMLALGELMRDNRPDLVLSGVNDGRNLAGDLFFSGTVAAAVVAGQLGARAIALSQCRDGTAPPPWACAEHHGPQVIRSLLAGPWPSTVTFSVNFPATGPDTAREMTFVLPGRARPVPELAQRTDLRQRPYYWLRPGQAAPPADAPADSDEIACANGHITVTPLLHDRVACADPALFSGSRTQAAPPSRRAP